MAVFPHKNSFCYIHRLNLFYIKTNLRENRLFGARWAFGDYDGTHNVKFIAEKLTKFELRSRQEGGVNE